jgi:tRNA-splicing ligase RtcB
MNNNIFGQHDEKTLVQFRDVESRAVKAALMGDGHVGYVMPIGGVAAYLDMVSVVGVGFDIACGNCAIKTDMNINDLGRSDEKRNFMLTRVADDIQSHISFGIGRSNKANDAPTDHALFESDAWINLKERAGHGEARRLKDKARDQLGTVGSGNHYVDVFADEQDGTIWVGVHFGSRGLGHGIATGFLNASVTGDWHDRAPEQETLLHLASTLGQDYWALMNLAGDYAYAGREWVTRKVVELLGAKEVEMIHNHHNFAWKEKHWVNMWPNSDPGNSSELVEVVVVRKGATPAFPGQKGFVGGSMGDVSVILEGTDSSSIMVDWNATAVRHITAAQHNSLFSTVHGAGRVMSRTEAAGKWDYKKKVRKTEGKVSPEMMKAWLTKEKVILRGGGLDESPHVYRRLPDVLKSQGYTITVLHTLKPLVVVMAGANEHDPYVD